MRVILVLAVAAIAGGLLVLVPTAQAAPGTGDCVKAGHALVIATLDSPNDTDGGTIGDAVSDGFFGNEPNLLNTNTDNDLGPNEVAPGSSAGFVEPSLSPGPKTVGGGFVTWGSIVRGSVPASCV